ncbi:MAG: L-threonylcarbamoyladenylate synthase [Anaerosomatales bacterium]|nr:L-threonylcarbamoyladenylate synthase [Anaerosomatales bacterium]MDT8434747.1 L-threonylcarbamoyladenylate synthase [Anaerosomatales bacterium]
MSKVFHIDPENPSAEVINLAATVLRDGGIVVFPTETVYGIGAAAHSCFGPHEIFDIKVRPLEKPLPWLVEDEDALDIYGVEVPEYAHNLAKAFWPGALSLVVKASDVVGPDFRADDGTVALRSPDHEVVMELIQASGGPIIATSANTSGMPAPGDFAEVEERILAAADVVLDGGETAHRTASTVVDCTGPEPVVLRGGAIPTDQIMAAARGGV